MLGVIILLLFIAMEIGILIFRLKTKSNQMEWRNKYRIGIFAALILLAIFGIIKLSFRWYLFYIIMLIQAIIAIIYFVKKYRNGKVRQEKPYKTSSVIFTFIRRCVLLVFLLFPAILFPQYRDLEVTGQYDVKTVSYTLEDKNRMEAFTDDSENRKVTIQFWYPDIQDEEKTFPVVIFSHGSFGFRGSNYSTYEELASNGYVVCSIDHTYYSFFTKQDEGKSIIVNQKFLNDAIAVQNDDYADDITYQLTHQWLDTRVADMNLVIDNILNKSSNPKEDEVYHLINTQKIGLFGHSIGGAAAAQVGRIRKDIDAVIVIDGTMVGEEVGFENGEKVLTKEAYPIPILNIFNEEHYQDALENKSTYANMLLMNNAVDAKQTVFKGSGHLNFTDLPMFSPFLANMLGTGEIDSRYCIETMNKVVLSYFDHYLKEKKELNLQNEY